MTAEKQASHWLSLGPEHAVAIARDALGNIGYIPLSRASASELVAATGKFSVLAVVRNRGT